MVSRLRHQFTLTAVLLGFGLLAVACQKVPLLAPSGSTITLIAAATALPVNGTTDIFAQLIEPAGTPPHAGTRVSFTTNLGTIQPSEAETDISGRVSVKFIAGSGSGTATITAISGGVSASGANAIKIAVGTAAVGSISVSANPTSLSASGGTSTITALVTDTSGNALPNVPVTFSTDNGSLTSSLVNTDGSGHAQTLLTTSRTAKITATAGIASSSGTTTTTAPSGTVTVNVNASATVSFGAPSPANPVAGQVVTFTLTVTPSTTGAAIRQVVVTFGDGAQQNLGAVSGATTLSHIYNGSGTYTVQATVTDSNGDSFPAVTSITIGNRPPATVAIAVSPVSPQPQVGQQVTFTVTTTFPASNSALVQGVTIDFGDGTQAQLGAQSPATAQHVYSTASTYTVIATVHDTNGGNSSSATQVVIVPKPNPAVKLTSAQNPSTLAQQPVTFTADVTQLPSGVTVDHYEWNFGDTATRNTSSNTTNHQYTVPNTYVVTVTAVMSDGTRSSSQIEQRVTN